jgi:phospholipid/cholesterol/gamma-HCH transport system ATP-binding protein
MAPIIEVEDVAIGWHTDAHLIDHATFTVERGEIFGILGRSASGKSTMMRVLVGLDEPLSGTILVEGRKPVIEVARPRWGVMFQQGALIGSMTVGENVALALESWTELSREAIHAVVRAKLGLVGLAHAIDMMPSELSGGMRKRAAIARALVLDPPLVFLDEPSSGLDPLTSAEIDHLIAALAREHGLTVVMVTHELGTITSIVDRCILLDSEEHRIRATGAPRQLAVSEDPNVRNFFSRAHQP